MLADVLKRFPPFAALDARAGVPHRLRATAHAELPEDRMDVVAEARA